MQAEDIIPVPEIDKCKRLLCVQPHPDDIDISAGGTILYLAEHGTEVYYLTITDDSSGFTLKGLSKRERKRIRKQEQRNAGEILGVKDFFWLDFPDAGDWSVYKARNAVIKYIRMLKPDFVMTVDPWLNYEAHRDHVKCGMAVSEAVILQSFRYIKTDRKTDRKYIPYEISGIIFSFTSRPNVVVDTDRFKDKKFKAAAQHRSQFDEEDLNKIRIYDEVHNSKLAEDQPFSYGEGFKILNPAMLHCISEAETA
ncbi:MAG: PIG-L family deacetylase [Spirochaetes bacterium]|nr:PIG-L family deacetylase [Spirochaetota bacterium]